MKKEKLFAVMDYIQAGMYFVLAVMEFIDKGNGSMTHGFIWLSIGYVWLNLAGKNMKKNCGEEK